MIRVANNHVIRAVSTLVSGRKTLWWNPLPYAHLPCCSQRPGLEWDLFPFWNVHFARRSFPHLMKSARLRQTNDFHVIIWIGGLWMPSFPSSPSLLLYNCCFSILVLQMNQLGSCSFLFTNADVLAPLQTHWMKISVFFFFYLKSFKHDSETGSKGRFFCLFVCLFKQAGPSEFFKLYRTLFLAVNIVL